MSDSEAPKFQWGQPVWVVDDLFNDGSYPNVLEGALLVDAGERGEIVQIGAHVESRTNVYLVEFSGHRVVGCIEDELTTSQPVPQMESQSP